MSKTLKELEQEYQDVVNKLNLSHMTQTFNKILMIHDGQTENITDIALYAKRCLYLFYFMKQKGNLSWEDLNL